MITPNTRFIQRLLKNKKFERIISSEVEISFKYDIPYLSGISRSGKRVYIDRDLRPIIKYRGDEYNAADFLVVHEVVEKTLKYLFGMRTKRAHQFAVMFEIEAIKNASLSWNIYCNFLQRQQKNIHSKKIQFVPLDLDLSAYKASDQALLKQLQNNLKINNKTEVDDFDDRYVPDVPPANDIKTSYEEYSEYSDIIKEY